eukprot:11979470-Alexandrium_andersonii.AAC.1
MMRACTSYTQELGAPGALPSGRSMGRSARLARAPARPKGGCGRDTPELASLRARGPGIRRAPGSSCCAG